MAPTSCSPPVTDDRAGHDHAGRHDHELRLAVQYAREHNEHALTQFNASSTTQGPLLGNSTLNTIKNTLASIVAGGVKNGSSSLNLGSIGISLQADGTMMSVDSTALTNALQNTRPRSRRIFNATNGIGEQLNASITNFTQTGGMIDVRTTALNSDLTGISTQQTNLNDYISQLTSQYAAQFTALNTLMATTNNSAYLMQLFGGTNSAGALATNK